MSTVNPWLAGAIAIAQCLGTVLLIAGGVAVLIYREERRSS